MVSGYSYYCRYKEDGVQTIHWGFGLCCLLLWPVCLLLKNILTGLIIIVIVIIHSIVVVVVVVVVLVVAAAAARLSLLKIGLHLTCIGINKILPRSSS